MYSSFNSSWFVGLHRVQNNKAFRESKSWKTVNYMKCLFVIYD